MDLRLSGLLCLAACAMLLAAGVASCGADSDDPHGPTASDDDAAPGADVAGGETRSKTLPSPGDSCRADEPMTVGVVVDPPTAGNPLARRLVVTTERACSLSGRVTNADEPGYAPSFPTATAVGFTHEMWFAGLLAAERFDFTIAPADDESRVLAAGRFETPALPWWMPRPEEVYAAPDLDPRVWAALLANVAGPDPDPPYIGDRHLVLIVDRQGRARFYHETLVDPDNPLSQFLEGLLVLPGGSLAWSNRTNVPAVDPFGREWLLFDVQLKWPHLIPTHHWFDVVIGPDFKRGLILFNRLGPGVECDLTTPTDFMVGDAVAFLDEHGVEVSRWDTFDHQDVIPPELMNLCTCDSGFWGPGTYDFTHMNYVQVIENGAAMLLSSRNLNRVIKVALPSGEVEWQLGRGADFAWLGDEPEANRWFLAQHGAQWLAPNRLLVFDNSAGRYIPCSINPWSRALELEVDEANRTVRQVWEHRTPFGLANGSLTRLPSGDTMIFAGWSNYIIQATPAGEEVWRLVYPRFIQLPNIPGGVPYAALWRYPVD